MVFDCFIFFDELDLLEFRLRLLEDVVDKFVICESNLTHSGNPKEYHLENNMSRFDKWKDKIIYLGIEQTKEGLVFRKVNTYTPDNGPALLEHQQRDALSYASEFMSEDDIVLMGDLDEMPDPNVIKLIKEQGILNKYEAISLIQLFHYYYMNCQVFGVDRMWVGTVVCSGLYFKKYTPQYLRNHRSEYSGIKNGGWHFSYLGGPKNIKKKIQSFAHTEFDRPEITAEENIDKAIKEGRDIFNRPGVYYKTVALDLYPEFLKKLIQEYPQFVSDEIN